MSISITSVQYDSVAKVLKISGTRPLAFQGTPVKVSINGAAPVNATSNGDKWSYDHPSNSLPDAQNPVTITASFADNASKDETYTFPPPKTPDA